MSNWLPDYGDLHNLGEHQQAEPAPTAHPPSPPRPQQETNGDALDYYRDPAHILNHPKRARIKSIILSKAQRPDETVSLQNSGSPARIVASPTSLEARVTVRYGKATFEVHLSGNQPGRSATGGWLETNILGPLQTILRDERGHPHPAEEPQFRNLMDHLCHLVIAGCNHGINIFISNAKEYTARIQLIVPPGGMTNQVLVPMDMTTWLDHRLYEELVQVVPRGRAPGGGYDVKFFQENRCGRGFNLAHNAEGFPDHNWTNKPDREYPVDPQFQQWA
ncbi:hypothetical protein CMUS01_08142 [Colletotrichum musicola]|uniref:Uncharacterized protein n=1 Tax=Colletotrichum musicola TaxID=2175873 RepID=A0A8H6KD64_9PEZI|nr:hypothetical protein CMUS01_08142 [Colletotrichum musicola]